MKKILLTKVFPTALTVSLIAALNLWPEKNQMWLLITAVLGILDGIVFIWMRLRKAPNIEITDEVVIVSGIKIDRRDIRAWRIFRALNNGDRCRYIELELARTPPSSFGWKIAKLFEKVPPFNRCDHGIPIAREPRIVASLQSWDLSKREIDHALKNSEQGSGGNALEPPSHPSTAPTKARATP